MSGTKNNEDYLHRLEQNTKPRIADDMETVRPFIQGLNGNKCNEEKRDRALFRGAVVAVVEAAPFPQRFAVVDDKQDAWNLLKNQIIGTVFVHKKGDKILAFNADCPHAGCRIQFASRPHPEMTKTVTEPVDMYYCPCHAAHFDLDGNRLDKVSPRNLDALEVELVDGMVCVKFQKFIFGIVEKRS